MQIKCSGTGPDVVLLHGWGMQACVWDEVVAELAPSFRVHNVSLPGYDGSAACRPYTLDTVTTALAAALPPRVSVCGWSLGGQLALRWALLKPRQIARMVLIASTPRFVRGPEWKNGVDGAVLRAYAHELTRDAGGALQRFALLQTQGDVAARKVSRRLLTCLAAPDAAGMTALLAGLKILEDTDLRSALTGVTQPALILHGERDRLVPLAAAEFLQCRLVRSTLETIAGAAHAPFIARPHEISRRIAAFCHD